MDQQPMPQQDAGAPRYSPDGRWYWDGNTWQPVVHQTVRPGPRRRWRPGGRFYVLAALIVVSGALLMGLVVRDVLSGFPANAIRVAGPGTREITLTEPGTYTINYERQAMGENARGDFEMGQSPEDAPAGTLTLVSKDTGEAIHLRAPSATFTYTVGNMEGQSIAQFQIDHPGTYALTSQASSQGSDRPFTLAISRGSPSDLLGYVVGGLVAGALLLIGGGLAILTLVLRVIRRERS